MSAGRQRSGNLKPQGAKGLLRSFSKVVWISTWPSGSIAKSTPGECTSFETQLGLASITPPCLQNSSAKAK